MVGIVSPVYQGLKNQGPWLMYIVDSYSSMRDKDPMPWNIWYYVAQEISKCCTFELIICAIKYIEVQEIDYNYLLQDLRHFRTAD